MIFDRLENRGKVVDINDWKDIYNSANGYESNADGLKEATYFRCLRVISESIAMCPLQVKKEDDKGEKVDKKHYLNDLLRLRPNPYMSAIDCMKTFVTLAKHEGIAGLYIDRHRRSGIIKGLYPVKITTTTIDNVGLIKGTMDNKILHEFMSVNGEEGICFDKDIIVLRDFTMDGINTKATRNVLKQNLDTSLKSQEYLNTLFQNGMTNKVVVQMTNDIKEEGEIKKVQDKFTRIYSTNGRIFTVPAGYNVSALNLSLADAQYEQLRRMSKEEIASMTGVPLTKLGFTKENAKSEEQDNLKFLQDTLLSIFVAIEQEGDYKLLTEPERKEGYKVRHNVNVLLRMDSKTQADVITRYTRNGIYSLNQAKDILGIEKLEEDVTLFPSGQVTLEMLQNGQVSWNKGTKPSDIGEGGDDINDGDY